MIVSSEANFSFTTKVNGDLLTVRGDTAADFQNNLDAFLLSDVLLDKVRAFAADAAGGSMTAAEATVNAAFNNGTATANPAVAAPAAPQGVAPGPEPVETLTDKWGNTWTYGLPNAPQSINGLMVLKEGRAKSGKPYKGWFDRTKGPKRTTPVGPPADPQFID